MATGLSAGALGAAGKWFTAILTSAAAIIALLVNAQNLGLTSWFGATEFGFAGYAARRVLVTPRADSLLAIGDTTILAATVTDRRGGVLVGVPLLWSSDDTTVATVDSAGEVVARGPGLARVTAEVREFRASANILVRQQVARVAITGDSTLMLPEADSARVGAIAFDARGHRIRGATIAWSSSDTFAVTVDSGGRIFSRAPGRAVLTASAGGRQGDMQVDVQLTPFRLALIDGAGQHAPAGRTLPGSVTFEAQSRGGLPVPGVELLLSAEGGTLDSDRVRTDARGRVRVTWSLGARPGPQQLRARISGIDSSVIVVAEADPLPAATRVELADSVLAGAVAAPLNPPVILRLTDPTGLPLADVPVGWSVLDGGSVTPLAPRTDSLGQVVGRWTLGRRVGRQRLKVQVGDARSMPAFTISATATAGRPSTLTVVSGADQKVFVGKAAQPVILQVRDSLGNAVPGAKLSAHATSGTFADSAPTSDKTGRVSLRWTAGTAPATAKLTLVSADSAVRTMVSARIVAPVVKPPPAKRAAPKPAPARKPNRT